MRGSTSLRLRALATLGATVVVAACFLFAPLAIALFVTLTIVGLLTWNWRLAPRGDSATMVHMPSADLAARIPPANLPDRAALLDRMKADGAGMLGVLTLADYQRLTAFDPAQAEEVVATCAARLRAMLPPSSLAVQLERGQLAIWFEDGSEAEARDRIESIAYALGTPIPCGGTPVFPQIGANLFSYAAGAHPDIEAFLARGLANISDDADESASAQPSRAEVARDRYALEQDLRQAIGRGELRLEFQPLVDAERQCVGGAEALIRWIHRDLGPIPPSRFVPIVEATGLAGEFGLWALNAATRTARDWAGQRLTDLRVAVNVSAVQLEDQDFAVLVKRTLERHDVPATALELELTESIATSDAARCRQIFLDLRAMGVKLAVDDFGTGYSGFSSLRQLAFDKIKIDREFVTDIDSRSDSQAICQSIIALGRGLGIKVLAEGVERHAEYAWLRRHGCHHFQGYYFGRPMSSAAFVAFARDRDRIADLLRLVPGDEPVVRRLTA